VGFRPSLHMGEGTQPPSYVPTEVFFCVEWNYLYIVLLWLFCDDNNSLNSSSEIRPSLYIWKSPFLGCEYVISFGGCGFLSGSSGSGFICLS
jgi:hypothetical protein